MSLKIAHDVNEKDRTEDIKIRENVDFSAMLLSENVLKGLKKCGYEQPSPIQLKAIPLGRCGFDLIVKAKSGTGKTAVFVITALEMIDISKNHPQVVILAPTREIAVQIQQVVKHIGSELEGLGVEYFIGGTPLSEDETKLQNCHVVVGAPGRVRHLIEKKLLDVSLVRLFVLDEADKLMEISFQQSINWIYNQLPKRKQVMAVSATYPDDLDKFLGNYMLSPTHVSPDTKMPILLGIRQFYTVVNSHLNAIQQMKFKTDELTKILSNLSFNQCLVFSNYQTRAESLSNNLNHQGWPSRFISGQQSQSKRLQAVDDLRKFKCRILSSTDLTARGIDAANVDLVVNYDVPLDVETYLHRMGRAGRYGSYGICITIASDGKELKNLQKIIKQLGNNVAIAKLPDPKYFKDIWHCDFNDFEHLHCSDDEEEEDGPIVSFRNNRLTAGESPKKGGDSDSNSDENSDSNLKQKVSTIICNRYNSNVNENEIRSVSQILKNVESQTSGKNVELNLTPSMDILKKLAKGNFQTEENASKKTCLSEKSCQSIDFSNVSQNTDSKLRAGCFDTNEFTFCRGPPHRSQPSVSENVEQYCSKQVVSPAPSTHEKTKPIPETVNQNRCLDTTYYEEVSFDTKAYKEPPLVEPMIRSPKNENKRSRIPQRSSDTQTQPSSGTKGKTKSGQKDDLSQKSFQSERKRWKSDKMMTTSEKFYVNRSRDNSPEPKLNPKVEDTSVEPSLEESFYSTRNDFSTEINPFQPQNQNAMVPTSQTQKPALVTKTETVQTFLPQNPNVKTEIENVENFQMENQDSTKTDLINSFLSRTPSEGNRLLFNAPCLEMQSENEMVVDNLSSRTDSSLNTLLGKNIALFKITKLVMENKFCDNFVKDCSKEVRKLLETLREEDQRQFKSFTIDDIKNFLEKNKISEIASKVILGGFSQNLGSSLTPGCCDDFLYQPYDGQSYSIKDRPSFDSDDCCCCPEEGASRASSIQDSSRCPSAMDVDQEYTMCTSQTCRNQCVKAHCDALRSRIERIEENLFSKSYDRVIDGPDGSRGSQSNSRPSHDSSHVNGRPSHDSSHVSGGPSHDPSHVSGGPSQGSNRPSQDTSVGPASDINTRRASRETRGTIESIPSRRFSNRNELDDNIKQFDNLLMEEPQRRGTTESQRQRKSVSIGGEQEYSRSADSEENRQQVYRPSLSKPQPRMGSVGEEDMEVQSRQYGSIQSQTPDLRRSLAQQSVRRSFEEQVRSGSIGTQGGQHRLSITQEQDLQSRQYGSLGGQSVGSEQLGSRRTTIEGQQRTGSFRGQPQPQEQILRSESFVVQQGNSGPQQQYRSFVTESGVPRSEYAVEDTSYRGQDPDGVQRRKSSLIKTIKKKIGSFSGTGSGSQKNVDESEEQVVGYTSGTRVEDERFERNSHPASNIQRDYETSEVQHPNNRAFNGQTEPFDDMEQIQNHKEASTEPFGFAANNYYSQKFLDFTVNNKSDKSIQSCKPSKNAYVSPELQDFVERRNVYTSYYQHYSNVLHESAPSFSDVHEFRDWFSKWREEVEAVRDFVQQDIYQNECDKDE